MRSKVLRIAAAFGLIATIGAVTLAKQADAGPRPCYRCTGGWCCY